MSEDCLCCSNIRIFTNINQTECVCVWMKRHRITGCNKKPWINKEGRVDLDKRI